MPIIDKKKYLCVGCGGCAVACPKQCITYTDNVVGQYIPVVDYKLCIDCKMCEKVCPVYNGEALSQTYRYNPIVGNYISCFKGFDERFRKTSASGGFLTATLYSLMDCKAIDYAVCVRNDPVKNSFYRYDILTDKENLIRDARSAYYPLEMSAMLKHIEEYHVMP